MKKLKPYDAYSDSRIPWLGRLPEHWEPERAKWLFQKMERPVSAEHEVVTCYRDGTVTLRNNRRARGYTESLKEIGYQGVRRGDLVIHVMDAFAGSVGVSDSDGKCTPMYAVCSPRRGSNPRYYMYLVREMARSGWITSLAKGIRERSTDFRFAEFANQRLPVPPSHEQAAIVRFLDYMDRRIRRYIAAKQKLIKVLEEQKQAIILRAVTRGLDSNVQMKASGIEWLDRVPQRWTVKPLKRWATINAATLGENTDPEFEFLYIDIGSVKTGRLVKEPDRIRFGTAPSRARRILRQGDTIISTVRTYLKAVWYVSEVADPIIASTGFAVLTPDDEVVSEYLGYVIQSNAFVDRVTAHSIGVAYPAIAESVLGRLPIAIPPTAAEQLAILSHIKRESAPLSHAIEGALREITLLREFRTRLIADVVTGKLDVREAAARLPEEAGEPEPLIESEAELADEGEVEPSLEEAEA
jgi:type I restriction enzyme, S subunit